MKKWFLVLSCVCAFSLVALIPLSAFAEDTPSYYQYIFTPVKSSLTSDYGSYMPSSFTVSSDVISTVDNSIIWHAGDSVSMASYVQSSNSGAKISYTVNGTSGNVYLAYDVPFYIYAEESSIDAVNGYDTLTGTPVYPPAPDPYGSSVSDGVSSGISYVGLVLSSIINSPVFIFVGLAVGCYLVTLCISKVKDLIKGY